MDTKLLKKYCVLDEEAKDLLRMAMTELGLSARAYDKVMRVARTVDLAQSEVITAGPVAEAVQYRGLDRHW